MLIAHIEGATRILGQKQGYIGLPVRDEPFTGADGKIYAKIVTAWEPTPEEAEAIANGAPIYLELLCVTPPPMKMTVGPVPDVRKEAGLED